MKSKKFIKIKMNKYVQESLENLFPFWEGGEEWLKWSGVTG